MPKFEQTNTPNRARQARIEATRKPIEKEEEFWARQSRTQDNKLKQYQARAERTNWLRDAQAKRYELEKLQNDEKRANNLLKKTEKLLNAKQELHEEIKSVCKRGDEKEIDENEEIRLLRESVKKYMDSFGKYRSLAEQYRQPLDRLNTLHRALERLGNDITRAKLEKRNWNDVNQIIDKNIQYCIESIEEDKRNLSAKIVTISDSLRIKDHASQEHILKAQEIKDDVNMEDVSMEDVSNVKEIKDDTSLADALKRIGIREDK